jgi:hypothetical protein
VSVDGAAIAAIPWGLLGPDELPSERRTRALELGAAVRHYNDLAVPGLGGVWYGRQLLWPALGVVLADGARRSGRHISNIEVANALEALACWLALRYGSTKRDPRLRGVTKLRIDEPCSYKRLSRAGAYVSQPMRMSAVQPLRALGLVSAESDRFNAFAPSTVGVDFLQAACSEFEPVWYKHGVEDFLHRWLSGDIGDAAQDRLHAALTPLKPLPLVAAAALKDLLIKGPTEQASRRRGALSWVAQVHQGVAVSSWDAAHPPMLSARHWHDLGIGAAFFEVRDRAIEALDSAERAIGPERKPLKLDKKLPDAVAQALQLATEAARRCLQVFRHEGEHPDALDFCGQLVTGTAADRLQALVQRDFRVLQLRDRAVIPAAAFEGEALRTTDDEAGQDDAPKDDDLPWPKGISYRIRNLHRLHLDLEGQLDAWLQQKVQA